MKSLIEMNDAVFAEYRRLTGSVDPLLFPKWWAEKLREVIRLQCDGYPEIAAARWGRLTRPEQQTKFLAYLGWLSPQKTGQVINLSVRRVA